MTDIYNVHILNKCYSFELSIHQRMHKKMNSEGSCDTEDLSNDAGNSVLHHRNKLHFKYIFK